MVIRGDWASPPPRKKTVRGGGTIPSPKQRPSGSGNGSIPAPIQRAPAPAPVYQAPAPPPAPAPTYYAPAAIQQGYSPQSFAQPAYSAPAPPPPEPVDTRRRINSKTIGNKEIAEIDSAFLDQDAALSEALKKFIADQEQEKGRQERDTKIADTGIQRNKRVGLTGMSEDFAARGMQNSGLFFKANTDSAAEYEKQRQQVGRMLADNLSKMASQRGKFESETNATRQAARNEALARLARRSDLVVE